MLVVFLALPGCVDRGEPCTGDCGDATVTSEPPILSIPQMQFSECIGVFGRIVVTAEQARPLVPEPFELDIEFLGTLGLAFETFQCKRAVVNTTVTDDFGLFRSYVPVVPKDRTWAPTLRSDFVLDFFLGPESLTQELEAFGFPARVGTVDRASASPLSMHEDWTLASAKATAAFGAARAERTFEEYPAGAHYWITDVDGYRRMDATERVRENVAQRQPGWLAGSGELALLRVGTEEGVAYQGTPIDSFTSTLALNSTKYSVRA